MHLTSLISNDSLPNHPPTRIFLSTLQPLKAVISVFPSPHNAALPFWALPLNRLELYAWTLPYTLIWANSTFTGLGVVTYADQIVESTCFSNIKCDMIELHQNNTQPELQSHLLLNYLKTCHIIDFIFRLTSLSAHETTRQLFYKKEETMKSCKMAVRIIGASSSF